MATNQVGSHLGRSHPREQLQEDRDRSAHTDPVQLESASAFDGQDVFLEYLERMKKFTEVYQHAAQETATILVKNFCHIVVRDSSWHVLNWNDRLEMNVC